MIPWPSRDSLYVGAIGILIAICVVLLFQNQGLRLIISKNETKQATEQTRQVEAWVKMIQEARAKEHAATDELEQVGLKLQQETRRADKLEDEVAAAVQRGERRVRNSICATTATVPAAPAAPGSPDGSADDGSRHIGRIVSAAAKCDAQVRGLQEVVRSYQRLINGR